MEKLKMHTPDLAEENYKKLAQLFPNAVTETITGYDDQGKAIVERAIDADVLRQEISASVVEGPQERYQFTWPDKKKSVVLANQPIAKTLRLVREKSVGRDGTQGSIDTENIYIEGDNLDALKLLQETYLGKVRLIYIDPPYNTGSDAFVYNDCFKENDEDYSEVSGQFDEMGNKLFDMRVNNESNGRFHTDWLNMMYPRLRLAKDFLSEDGVIFISIDDNEIENLKKMCDEIFGTMNFVGLFFRKTKAGGGSASGSCAVEHDYVICYTRNNKEMEPLIEQFGEKYLKRYKEKDDLGAYFWDTMERSSTATKPYTITAPDGTILKGKWFRSESTFKRDLETGEVRFLKKADGGWSVQFKQRLAEGKRLRTIIDNADLTDKQYRSLSQELENIVGCSLGHPPKPVSLLTTLIYSVCSKSKADDIIMDFFSGSATTAHAVIKLNAEDGGRRHFIMVQIPEEVRNNAMATDAGFKTVCDIGEERIRRVGKIIPEELQLQNFNFDIGFRVFKVDTTNMEDVYYKPTEYRQEQLAFFANNIKKDRTPEDLLFQVMLDLGILLSSKIEETVIAGKKVFSVADGYLIVCFDDNVTEEAVKAIAQKHPFYAVFRDSGMASDSVMTNFEQIFETYSPRTQRKVL